MYIRVWVGKGEEWKCFFFLVFYGVFILFIYCVEREGNKLYLFRIVFFKLVEVFMVSLVCWKYLKWLWLFNRLVRFLYNSSIIWESCEVFLVFFLLSIVDGLVEIFVVMVVRYGDSFVFLIFSLFFIGSF